MVRLIKTAALVMCMTILCAGCGVQTPITDSNELKIAVTGKKPEDFDKITEEAQRRLKEDGVGEFKLNFEFISDDDAENNYKDTMYVRLLAGEEYDIVYDSTGNNFSGFRKMQIYKPLDEYILESDKYPHLKELYPMQVWTVQKNSNEHIYGIPRFKNYGYGINCIYYRQDFADEWGMGTLDDMDDVYEYMHNCLKYKKEMKPTEFNEYAGARDIFQEDEAELLRNHIVKYSESALIFYALLDETNSKTEQLVFFNEPAECFDVFPEQYKGGRGLEADRLLKCSEWKDFFDSDKDRKAEVKKSFEKCRTAAYYGGYADYYSIEKELKKTDVDARVGRMYVKQPEKENEFKRFTKLSFSSYTCIPSSSSKAEKSLAFLDWLASDAENQNLFAFGIEGEHWEYDENGSYKKIKDTYTMKGENLTNNPANLMLSSSVNAEIKENDSRNADFSEYIVSPIAGFVHNPSKISDELDKINGVIPYSRMQDFKNGRVENPAEEMRKDYEKVKKAEDKIRDELIRQLNYFLEHGENE